MRRPQFSANRSPEQRGWLVGSTTPARCIEKTSKLKCSTAQLGKLFKKPATHLAGAHTARHAIATPLEFSRGAVAECTRLRPAKARNYRLLDGRLVGRWTAGGVPARTTRRHRVRLLELVAGCRGFPSHSNGAHIWGSGSSPVLRRSRHGCDRTDTRPAFGFRLLLA